MCDPHPLASLDLHSGPRTRTRDDNIGAFPSDGGSFTEYAVTNRLANTYLRVRARTRESCIGHALACGQNVLELMPVFRSDWIRAGHFDRLCVLAGCHRDLPPDITKSVSGSDDSVLPRPQLDITPG